METLLEITTKLGTEMQLEFNPAKSAVVRFSPAKNEKRTLYIQGKEIPYSSEYKYLGITLCDGKNHLETQEKIWSEKARKAVLLASNDYTVRLVGTK